MLVDSRFRQARPAAAATMEGLVPVAKAADWPGYLGSPRLSTAAHGAKVVDAVAAAIITAANSVLDGADPRQLGRFARVMERSPTDVLLDAASLAAEAQRAQRQQEWIGKRHRPLMAPVPANQGMKLTKGTADIMRLDSKRILR